MARSPRIDREDCFYHIASRGDDRKAIFKSECDYQKFLECLAAGREKYKYYVHAYCLMTNHYHLFLETTQANLSRIIQYLNTSYTVYYNVKRKRSGHLFQGRYKSIIVEEEGYYAKLSRYIHLNPVRAKMVDNPIKYPWSSYKAYVSGKGDACIDVERIKKCLGMDSKQYRKFVENGIKECPDPLKDVYAGFILGTVEFIKDKLDQLKYDVKTKDFAYRRALRNVIEPQEIIDVVADHFKEKPQDLCNTHKKNMTAKKAAIYMLRRKTGMTNNQIGDLFGMRLAAVSMAARGFEKKMESDRRLRRQMDELSLKFEG